MRGVVSVTRSAVRAFMIAALAMVVLPTASSADPVSSPPSDPLGDVPAGPDVTQVAVLHPMTSGPLIFTVSVASEPVLLDGSVIELRLDTDMDASTGSVNGVERLIHRLWTGSTRLCSWTGAGFSCASSPFVSSTYVDGFLTVTTTATALGIAGAGFDYSVAAYNSPDVDFAPDSGTWRYSLAPPVPADCPGPGRCKTRVRTAAAHH
jgi:hypothetical protein